MTAERGSLQNTLSHLNFQTAELRTAGMTVGRRKKVMLRFTRQTSELQLTLQTDAQNKRELLARAEDAERGCSRQSIFM